MRLCCFVLSGRNWVNTFDWALTSVAPVPPLNGSTRQDKTHPQAIQILPLDNRLTPTAAGEWSWRSALANGWAGINCLPSPSFVSETVSMSWREVLPPVRFRVSLVFLKILFVWVFFLLFIILLKFFSLCGRRARARTEVFIYNLVSFEYSHIWLTWTQLIKLQCKMNILKY